jgi:hypothetical protein
MLNDPRQARRPITKKIEDIIAELKMLTDADALMGKETESEQENPKDRKSDDEADMSSMDSDKVK